MTASGDIDEQKVPAWSAFNALVHRTSVPAQAAIGYCPVVNSSPTEMSTVYATLSKCLHRCVNAGLPFTLMVFDQAIYAKALDIVTQRKDEFSSVVLRMGAFHICCTFMAILGKRFRDAGLMDLLVESGVAGVASASSALAGKQYNRAIRLHKIVSEALERMRWKEFVSNSDPTDLANWQASIGISIQKLQSCITDENLGNVVSSPALHELHKRYADYCCQRAEASEMFKFWKSYLDMVCLLLRFVRSSRIGDWDLHLQCIREMLPWCFAYDRQNYARFMTYYWLQMTQLPQTHPEADLFLRSGGFSVQRSNNSFAMVPSDQAIEQSMNRETKTTGGIVGFSRHPGTVQRWVLTAHDRAAVADVCMEHCGLDDATEERDTMHKECQTSRMARDETDVLHVIDTCDGFLNPFLSASQEQHTQLTQLASGIEASSDVAQDLLQAEEHGLNRFKDFIRERLISGNSSKEFYDPLQKLNLKTFSVQKSKKTSGNNPREILRSDRSTFSRIALIAQTRQMDMREVLAYPLGPLPWALAATDGSLIKTSKSALLPLLTDGAVLSDDQRTTDGALIVDGMALLRSIKAISMPPTFGEYADLILSILCRFFNKYTRIDFIADTYCNISIKNTERSSRAAGGSVRQHVTGPDQHLPRQFNKFLAVGANKEELIAFLASQWQRPDRISKIPHRKVLVVTSRTSCVMLKWESGSTVVVPVPELECSHEEADTRLLLHACHAARSNNYPTITIKSPDTDVVVLAIAFSRYIPAKLYFLTGTGNKLRCIDMNAASEKLGADICGALPGFHAFTGCDSVSAFAFRGKKTAFKLLQGSLPANAAVRDVFSKLGTEFQQLSQECLDGLERFVCLLYNVPGCNKLDSARYELFCTKSLQSNQLPPCRDAFVRHSARANHQAAIWRRCLVPRPEVPAPHDNGQGQCITFHC